MHIYIDFSLCLKMTSYYEFFTLTLKDLNKLKCNIVTKISFFNCSSESLMQLCLMENYRLHSVSSTFTVRKLPGSKRKKKISSATTALGDAVGQRAQGVRTHSRKHIVSSPHAVTHQRQRERTRTSPLLLGYPEGSGQAWSPARLSTSPSGGGWQWEIHRPGGRGEYCSQQQSRREETRPHTSPHFSLFFFWEHYLKFCNHRTQISEEILAKSVWNQCSTANFISDLPSLYCYVRASQIFPR